MSDRFTPPATPNIVDGNVGNFVPDVGGQARVAGRRANLRRRKDAAKKAEFRENLGLPQTRPVADPNAKPEVKDLLPEEDLSPQAIQRRETIDFESARDFLRSSRGPEEMPDQQIRVTSATDVGTGLVYGREKAYATSQEKFADIWKRRGKDLSRFPSLARAVAEAQSAGADVTEQDIVRLLNFAEVDRAANIIIANDWDQRKINNILLTSDDITRAAIADILPEKIKQIQEALIDLETADSNVVIDAGGRVVGGAMGGVFQVWEKGQQLFRAFGYYDPETAAESDFYEVAGGILAPLRVPFNWNKVASGKFNENYIQQIRESGNYSDTEINVVLDMAIAQEEGSEDPIGDAIMRYSDDPEAVDVIRGLIYRYLEDPRLNELVRQVDSAKLGSTGQLLISSLLGPSGEYSEWRGSKLRGGIANASSVFFAFAADPILIGAATRTAYLSAKFSMINITKTQNVDKALASQKVAGVERNRFRSYVERFTDDLKKLDIMEAEASNLARIGASTEKIAKMRGDAASLRNMITRQYKEFPEDVIEVFRKANVRSVDDFGQFVKDGNNAMLVLRGDAPKLADTSQLFAATRMSPGRGGPQPYLDFATLGERLIAVGYMGKRAATVPRMSIGRELRQTFVRAVPATVMPSRRGQAAIASFYQGTDDIDQVVKVLNENYAEIGRLDQLGGVFRSGAFTGTAGKMVDTTFRRFASLPNKNFLYTGDARDAKTFYQFARQYFTKYHSTYLTDIYRAANEGQRRLMLIGLVRAAASSRGVSVSKSQATGKVTLADDTRPIIESLTTGGADDLFAPQVIQPVKSGSTRVTQYGDEAQIARVAEAQSDEVLLNPSLFGGRQHALHLAQTTPYVSIPSPAQIEALRWWKLNAPGWIQKVENSPQAVTDFWSLFTLYGFRYSQRNMVEDLWMYMMTAGRVRNLYLGRRMSTALRDSRPGLELKKDKLGNIVGQTDEAGNFIPEIVEKQRVGMVAKKSRDFGNWLRRNDTDVQRTASSRMLGAFFLGSIADEKVLTSAYLAAKNGDLVPMQKLAIAALTRQRLTTVTKQQVDDLGDLVLNPMGLKMLDDLAETGRFINQGTFPVRFAAPDGTDTPGVITYAVPEKAPTMGGKFVSVPPTAPNGNLYWFRSINSVVEFDGPIGRIAVQNLNNRERAVELIAKAIREDKDVGYLQRMSAFYEAGATPEQFAYRYFDDVFNTFSNKDGQINRKLWDKIAPFDPQTRSRVVSLTDADGTLRVTPESLRTFGVKDSPQYVLGRESQAIPTAGRMEAFYGSNWSWMGEQYARIAREPIFLGNYLEQREILRSYERYLAENIGDAAAKKTVAKISTERAYWFTLNYVDNPRNRSQMAWKVRNVSRYYRATEDFYRRITRVGKNYPEGLWKTALTYQILDDTGFVYEDQNGDKFFAYPGNEQLQWAVNEFMNRVIKPGTSGVGVLPGNWTFDPFIIGGKVTGVAPSTDPKQLQATISGPLAALGANAFFSLVPSMKGLERYILGEYGVGSSYWDLIVPAQIARVLRVVNPDEANSTFASAIMDAVAIAVVEDLIPMETESGDPITEPSGLERTKVAETITNIAIASVVTRMIMGFAVPASPQLYVNNTSSFAKLRGWPSMRAGFLKLVEKYKDEPDPVKSAFQAWWKLSPNLMPYTVGKTTDVPGIEGRAELRPFNTVKKWYLSGGKELYENPRYGSAALFLAPRDGEFSPGAWSLVSATLGLRQERDLQKFLRDAIAAKGQFQHYATIADYQEDIDKLNPLDANDRRAISELEAEKAADLAWLREDNPYWELKWAEENESAAVGVYASRLLDQTTNLVEDLKSKGQDTEESRAIRSAIMTFNDYMSDYEAIVGNTRADQDRKRELRMEMSLDMEKIAQRNPNVELFIKNVIRPLTPRGTGI